MVRRACILAVIFVLFGGGAAAAEPYTNQFRGDGSSSFGFAWEYALRQVTARAEADGFLDPANQCTEIFRFGNVFSATLIWECTREI